MRVLGICGSTRKESESGTHFLVREVLESSGVAYDFVSLRGRKILGCTACLGCVEDNVCVLDDDLAPLREKIVEADAYVVGAPNFYSGLNAATHAFLERWYQFRHREGSLLWGKLGVAVGVGGAVGKFPADEIERFFLYSFIEPVAKVTGQGAACCFTCGHGETCGVGVPRLLWGEGAKITPETIPDVRRQAPVVAAARDAGRLLGDRLRGGHDRAEVKVRMQAVMMQKFKTST